MGERRQVGDAGHAAPSPRAFSLVELLVTIAVIALLVGILLPSLARARETAREIKCSSNQRQLLTAWSLYAGTYRDYAMPLGYWEMSDIGANGEQVYWWGTHGTTTVPPRHDKGFIAPFLDSGLAANSVFECPDQPLGTYEPQGPARSVTSTYGYNGYYLSPAKTPGYGQRIGQRPWRRTADIPMASDVFVFADTLIHLPRPGRLPVVNSALLDPPLLYMGAGRWEPNLAPTTAFRHGASRSGTGGRAIFAAADGSVRKQASRLEWLRVPRYGIGSVGVSNGPHYVPDWREWQH